MNPRNEQKKIEIYDYINEFIKEYGVSPSIPEIADGVHCAGSTVHKYLVRLEEEGYIEKYGRNQIVTRENSNSIERIPVVGAIACGKPKLAIEDIQTYIPINKDILGQGEFIALIADGDSMIDAGIDDGDLVFIRKQPTAVDGQVVTAIIQDEYSEGSTATLKRLYRDGRNHKFRLHPENEYMDDIFVDELNIVGVAIKVLKDIY